MLVISMAMQKATHLFLMLRRDDPQDAFISARNELESAHRALEE